MGETDSSMFVERRYESKHYSDVTINVHSFGYTSTAQAGLKILKSIFIVR